MADQLLRHCPDGLLPECLRCGHPTQGLQRDHCPACGERVRWRVD
jgi:ribosomal protein L37E